MEQDRRHDIRRVEDLEGKYKTLEYSLEGIKAEHQSIKNLIQSNTQVTQLGNKLIETKLENMNSTLGIELKRAESKSKEHDDQITELRELANKIMGSLAVFNWLGFAGIIMIAIAFFKYMITGKP